MNVLAQITQHIADGHYHTELRDRFVAVLRIEGLEDTANRFAALPDRSDYGVESGWCVCALDLWISCGKKGHRP